MPIIFDKNRIVVINNEDELSEIFGHNDYDGLQLRNDDYIIFDNGMISKIVTHENNECHSWNSPWLPNDNEISEIKAKILTLNKNLDLSKDLKSIIDELKLKNNNIKTIIIISVVLILLTLVIVLNNLK